MSSWGSTHCWRSCLSAPRRHFRGLVRSQLLYLSPICSLAWPDGFHRLRFGSCRLSWRVYQNLFAPEERMANPQNGWNTARPGLKQSHQRLLTISKWFPCSSTSEHEHLWALAAFHSVAAQHLWSLLYPLMHDSSQDCCHTTLFYCWDSTIT